MSENEQTKQKADKRLTFGTVGVRVFYYPAGFMSLCEELGEGTFPNGDEFKIYQDVGRNVTYLSVPHKDAKRGTYLVETRDMLDQLIAVVQAHQAGEIEPKPLEDKPDASDNTEVPEAEREELQGIQPAEDGTAGTGACPSVDGQQGPGG